MSANCTELLIIGYEDVQIEEGGVLRPFGREEFLALFGTNDDDTNIPASSYNETCEKILPRLKRGRVVVVFLWDEHCNTALDGTPTPYSHVKLTDGIVEWGFYPSPKFSSIEAFRRAREQDLPF